MAGRRPLYALSQGLETAFGHLERDGSSFALLNHSDSELKKVVIHRASFQISAAFAA